MLINDIIMVHVSGDGDVAWHKYGTKKSMDGTWHFTGDDAVKEAMAVVHDALLGMHDYFVAQHAEHGRDSDGFDPDLRKIAETPALLAGYMYNGGCYFGNPDISVEVYGDRYEDELLELAEGHEVVFEYA